MPPAGIAVQVPYSYGCRMVGPSMLTVSTVAGATLAETPVEGSRGSGPSPQPASNTASAVNEPRGPPGRRRWTYGRERAHLAFNHNKKVLKT